MKHILNILLAIVLADFCGQVGSDNISESGLTLEWLESGLLSFA